MTRTILILAIATLLGCGGTIGGEVLLDINNGTLHDEMPLHCPDGHDVVGRGHVRRHQDPTIVETRDLPCLTGDGTLAGGFLPSLESSLDNLPFADDHQFLHEPDDPGFNAVQAYYTITHMANWISASFGPEDPRLSLLRSDNVHLDYDSSELESRQVCHWLLLGIQGFEHDRVNVDVLTHEFGHHIVFAMNRNLGNQMIHEGLADYFAAAFTRDDVVEPSDWSGFDRDLRNDRRAPHDLLSKGEYCQRYMDALAADNLTEGYTAATNILSQCLAGDNLDRLEPHAAGMILSAALWQLRDQMGDETLNRVLAHGLHDRAIDDTGELLTALVEADQELFDGLNESLLWDAFSERGIDLDLDAGFPHLDYASCEP